MPNPNGTPAKIEGRALQQGAAFIYKSIQKNRHAYYDWYLDVRAGGPTGYLANLLLGLNRLGANSIPICDADILTQFAVRLKQECVVPPQEPGLYRKLTTLLQKSAAFNHLYVNYLSTSYKQQHRNYMSFLNNGLNQRANQELINRMDFRRTRSIHVHEIGDAI